jgi:hypothetical protein
LLFAFWFLDRSEPGSTILILICSAQHVHKLCGET